MLMWEMPYTYLSILLISPSWYLTIWFGILCAVLTSLVMWVVYRWHLRKVERSWLGQAAREGQQALHSLSTANVEKHDD